MFEINGLYDTAKVFADNVEESAIAQLMRIVDHPAMEGAHIRIMPDVHAGAGCVIGFTAKVTDKIIPNLIGVDIGCGVLSNLVELPLSRAILPIFDVVVRENVPVGFHVHKGKQAKSICLLESNGEYDSFLAELTDVCERIGTNSQYAIASLGTLGGGNHFIELDEKEDVQMLVVHSGSRNFGLKVANYYQNIAESTHPYITRGLAWLEGKDAENYLHDMAIAQEYAKLNRKFILSQIERSAKLTLGGKLESVHNYIHDGIIRKGAISANKGEQVIIPMNMRDGTIVGVGKGSEDWNCSAPHGAGRTMSRSVAKRDLSVAKFRESMRDVYSTSVNKYTLDESPMAYKPMDLIINSFGDSIESIQIVKPIWNLKSNE